MPELHWIHYADLKRKSKETVVDNNLLCQGKVVFLRHSWLSGEDPLNEVTALTFQEDPTWFFWQILKSLRILKFGAPSEYKVIPLAQGGVESAEHWSAGARNPSRFAAYHFEDGFGNRSPTIWVTDSARKKTSTSGAVGIGAMWESMGAKVHGGRHTLRVWTCNKDPDLTFELLLPGRSGKQDLWSFAAEYLGYLAPNLAAEEALDVASDGYLRREVPSGWDIRLERDSISLGEDEAAAIAVTISAPSRGTTAFAVRVAEKSNPDNFVVSPIVEVHQPHAHQQEGIIPLKQPNPYVYYKFQQIFPPHVLMKTDLL
jgi:hypothetical protein